MLLLKTVSTYILQNIANYTAQWSSLAIRAVSVKVRVDEARNTRVGAASGGIFCENRISGGKDK